MTALPPPAPVREVSGLDRTGFDRDVRPLGQPVVIRGLGAGWPAVQAAGRSSEAVVDYLLACGPTRPITAMVGAPEIEGRLFYQPDFQGLNFTTGTLPLATFLDRILRDRSDPRPFALAVQSEPIPELLPGFAQANRIELIDASVVPRIWIGNAIHVAPHYDLKENIGVVVAGRRRFTLFPPEQLPNLYMGPLEFTPAGTPVSLVELAAPDLERFPRYAEAARFAQVAVLEEGDAIYIPFHWWHGVDSLEKVNVFVNYWWTDAQPDLGGPYDALLHALFALRGLPPEQRAVWRMVFDNLVFGADDPLTHMPSHAKGVLGPVDAVQLGRMRATLRQILGKL